MPEIEIRPAIADDIQFLTGINHNYTSDRAWQLEIQQEEEDGYININFREIRLPRRIQVKYPRSFQSLVSDWTQRSGLLVAVMSGKPIGYISLMLEMAPETAWATDIVVDYSLRRKGIGSALIFAGLEWALNHASRFLVVDVQTKNYPAIKLARKLGFEFCGYNDRYYSNNDIGIFFSKALF